MNSKAFDHGLFNILSMLV